MSVLLAHEKRANNNSAANAVKALPGEDSDSSDGEMAEVKNDNEIGNNFLLLLLTIPNVLTIFIMIPIHPSVHLLFLFYLINITTRLSKGKSQNILDLILRC